MEENGMLSGAPDLQDVKVLHICNFCGGEIYEGNEYKHDWENGNIFCNDECVLGWASETIENLIAGE